LKSLLDIGQKSFQHKKLIDFDLIWLAGWNFLFWLPLPVYIVFFEAPMFAIEPAQIPSPSKKCCTHISAETLAVLYILILDAGAVWTDKAAVHGAA
jgi:hypothetical protein